MKLGLESLNVKPVTQAAVEPKKEKKPSFRAVEGMMLLANKDFEYEVLKLRNQDLRCSLEEMNVTNLMHVRDVIAKGQLNNSLAQYLKIGGDFESFIKMQIPEITKDNQAQISQEVLTAIDGSMEAIPGAAAAKAGAAAVGNFFKAGWGKAVGGVKAVVNKIPGKEPIKNGFAKVTEKGKTVLQFSKKTLYSKPKEFIAPYAGKGANWVKGLSPLKLTAFIAGGVTGIAIMIGLGTMLLKWKKSMSAMKKYLEEAKGQLSGKTIDAAIGDTAAQPAWKKSLLSAKSFEKNIKTMEALNKFMMDMAGKEGLPPVGELDKLLKAIGYKMDEAAGQYVQAEGTEYVSGATLGEAGWVPASITKAIDSAIAFADSVEKSKIDIDKLVKDSEAKAASEGKKDENGQIEEEVVNQTKVAMMGLSSGISAFMKESYITVKSAVTLAKLAVKSAK